MKKITSLLMAAAVATTLGLVGCKKDKKDEGATNTPKTEEPKPADPAAGGTAPAGGAGTDPAVAGGAAAGGAAAAGGNTGIAECDEYIKVVDKYVSCDKIPQASRDATKQGLDTMRKGWSSGMPDDAKKAAADACKAGTDAVKQGAQALGCAL